MSALAAQTDADLAKLPQALQDAYLRGKRLSEAEHGKLSTRLQMNMAAERMAEVTGLQEQGLSFRASRSVPNDLIEEYVDSDEQVFFAAGWIDGTWIQGPLSLSFLRSVVRGYLDAG